MKHTPGPWKWNPDDDDNAIVGADGFSIICGVWHNDSTAGAEVCRPVDARLIAKAPEILAMLKELLDVYREDLAIGYRDSITRLIREIEEG